MWLSYSDEFALPHRAREKQPPAEAQSENSGRGALSRSHIYSAARIASRGIFADTALVSQVLLITIHRTTTIVPTFAGENLPYPLKKDCHEAPALGTQALIRGCALLHGEVCATSGYNRGRFRPPLPSGIPGGGGGSLRLRGRGFAAETRGPPTWKEACTASLSIPRKLPEPQA